MRWSRLLSLATICALSFCLSISLSTVMAQENSVPQPFDWKIPAVIPKPIVPEDNPMNAEKVELGRHLFYEKRLSITGNFACASCHIQSRAFTDGKPVAVGATGQKHLRSAMSLANVAYSPVLTWGNPLLTTLESQTLIPLFGEDPVEMGMVGLQEQILAMLRDDPKYQRMFAAAFGADNSISISNLTKALAAFERTLISVNSPYDRYRYGGDLNAISAEAKRGERLFNSDRLECSHCHSGFNFTDSLMHERLALREINFHNNGLYNIDGKGSYPPRNTGIREITLKPSDMGKFKVPTLRNIALTAPYMHDGSIATLEEVIDHYVAGGRTIHTGEFAGDGSKNPYKDGEVSGFDLTEDEKSDLLAFLHSLTDETFINNPALSNPNNAPEASSNDDEPN